MRFFQPEELFQFLNEQILTETAIETRVKGYRIKVEYGNTTTDEAKRKGTAVSKTIINAHAKKK